MKQDELVKNFCKDACFFWVKIPSVKDEELGKIISNEEFQKINLSDSEIHRSIQNNNDDKLFVLDLKPEEEPLVSSQLDLLSCNLDDARTIEQVYPKIFTWCFDGLSIKGYAMVPSGDPKAHTTISRYGGTVNFIKILNRHLDNIAKMRKGTSPNYEFFNIRNELPDTEICVGSINRRTDQYSIIIDLNDSWNKIIKNSRACKSLPPDIRTLEMKYWAREINPDFINEAKHIRLKNTLSIGESNDDRKKIYDLYPEAIKRIMALPHKGNLNRYLIARFLLSVHSVKDAKFMYYSILGQDELEHVKNGNCKTQWSYITNNIERYSCPSMRELESFTKEGDEKISHPLEKIQKYIEEQKLKEEQGE
jgi:hypothetical protein